MDGVGHLYFAWGNEICEMLSPGIPDRLAAQGESNPPFKTLASSFNSPMGIAVDSFGNVFVADTGNNAIKEILAGSPTVLTLASGFKSPVGVAVDGNGICSWPTPATKRSKNLRRPADIPASKRC